MRNAILIAAAIGLVAPTTSALAQKQARIEYSDLNLDTAEGQKKLDQRIRSAAEEVCNLNTIQTGTRIKSSQAKRCVAETTAKIKQSLAAHLDDKNLGG